jgi:hypothetical protein
VHLEVHERYRDDLLSFLGSVDATKGISTVTP